MAVVVVLALTGFSTGRGHGGTSSSGGSDDGGGGGGCSSSSQDHDTSSSSSGGSSSGLGKSDDDDYDDDTYDDSYDSGATGITGSTGTRRDSPEDGTAKLVSCVSSGKAYATVEVTNPNAYESDFVTVVTFLDKSGETVVADDETVTVPADGVAKVRVYVGDTADLADVDHCEVEPEALWTSG